MSQKNPTQAPGVRQVIVDIPTHDDDGKPITDDMLSSGGARDRGPLRKQYTNPRPYDPATDKPATAKAQRTEAVLGAFLWVWDEFGRDWWRDRGPADLRRAGGWVKSQAQRLRKPVAQPAAGSEGVQADAAMRPDVAADPSGAVGVGDATDDVPLAPVTPIEDFRRSA